LGLLLPLTEALQVLRSGGLGFRNLRDFPLHIILPESLPGFRPNLPESRLILPRFMNRHEKNQRLKLPERLPANLPEPVARPISEARQSFRFGIMGVQGCLTCLDPLK